MKTNNDAKRVLVYGDSLTYGRQSGENARLPASVRFTGVLQDLLGDGFEVIEEGLRARMLSGENPHFQERNGLQQFGPILGSHLPLDVVVIVLGTNDANQNPAFNAQAFARTLHDYVQKLKDWSEFFALPLPRTLVVLPPDIDESHYDEGIARIFGPGAGDRVKQLRQEMRLVAESLGLTILDSSEHCIPAPQDGVHLDAENNKKLAQAVNSKLAEFLN
jgi:lysophospholipase L1-like esterase